MNFSCFEPCLDFTNLEAEHCGRSNGKGNRSGILTAWLQCLKNCVIWGLWRWSWPHDVGSWICTGWCHYVPLMFHEEDSYMSITFHAARWFMERSHSAILLVLRDWKKVKWVDLQVTLGLWWKSARWPDVRMDISTLNDICGCWVVDYCTSMRSAWDNINCK